LLGVPAELHDRCVVLSNDIAVWMAISAVHRKAPAWRNGRFWSWRAILWGQCASGRGARKDDLLDVVDGRCEAAGGLSEEDLYAQCVMLLFAATRRRAI